MKYIKQATEIARLITATLMTASAVLLVAKNLREYIRAVAEDDGLVEKLARVKTIVDAEEEKA